MEEEFFIITFLIIHYIECQSISCFLCDYCRLENDQESKQMGDGVQVVRIWVQILSTPGHVSR